MVNNKKGFLKIVEATIAILIIIGVLLVVVSNRQQKKSQDLTDNLFPILEEMARNQSLRAEVFQYNTSNGYTEAKNSLVLRNIDAFVGTRIKNKAYNHTVRICNLVNCPLQPYPNDAKGDIFAAERVISTNLDETNFSPRKVKIFLW
ncbi:MAG: hypothetical protein Q7S74_02265 [Nanoarchaeota archaeon]|nr:hypothetical protein [Nanoarchaeota archaeon]